MTSKKSRNAEKGGSMTGWLLLSLAFFFVGKCFCKYCNYIWWELSETFICNIITML